MARPRRCGVAEISTLAATYFDQREARQPESRRLALAIIKLAASRNLSKSRNAPGATAEVIAAHSWLSRGESKAEEVISTQSSYSPVCTRGE